MPSLDDRVSVSLEDHSVQTAVKKEDCRSKNRQESRERASHEGGVRGGALSHFALRVRSSNKPVVDLNSIAQNESDLIRESRQWTRGLRE